MKGQFCFPRATSFGPQTEAVGFLSGRPSDSWGRGGSSGNVAEGPRPEEGCPKRLQGGQKAEADGCACSGHSVDLTRSSRGCF